jgi:beta-lactamase regulating signal transducer with metallopeptidase domain
MLSSLQRLVQFAGGHVVNGLIEGIFIAAFVSAFIWLLSRENSKTRFAVWFWTLLTVAVLPFLGFEHKATAVLTGTPRLDVPATWAEYALLAWTVVAFAGLVRVVISLVHVWNLKRCAREISSSELIPELQRVVEESRWLRNFELRVSDPLRVPTAVGFFRPAVILPRWVLEELSPAEVKAVLLHELGHLRRWDDWTNLAQKLLRSVFFFHPAVWWIDSRLNLEREMACDDLVLAATANARGYAECLVSVAEKSSVRSRLALALAAVSRMKATALRVARILDGNRIVDTRMSRAAVSTIAVVSAFAFIALPHTPALVAFQANPAAAQVAESGITQTGVRPGHIIPARYDGRRLSPKVINAEIHYGGANEFHQPLKRTTLQRSKKIYVIPKRETTPRVTRASFQQQQPAQSFTVLLVFQTSESDDIDAPNWTICIWQFGTAPGARVQVPTQVRNGTTSKSI